MLVTAVTAAISKLSRTGFGRYCSCRPTSPSVSKPAGCGPFRRGFGAGDEDIPEYDRHVWNEQWQGLDGAEDYQAAEHFPVWQFYRVAAVHRTYVLRDLLSKHGLVVD